MKPLRLCEGYSSVSRLMVPNMLPLKANKSFETAHMKVNHNDITGGNIKYEIFYARYAKLAL